MAAPKTVDEYIATFPPNVQKLLQKVRKTIQRAAPDATEAIKYQIPTFVRKGNLISFAGYEHHIGVYPAPVGAAEWKGDLARYASGKATARFPLDEPIPVDLITRIVKFRVAQMDANQAKKK